MDEASAMIRIIRDILDYITIKRSQLFDRENYLNENEDVKARGGDPLWHFVRSGWREGRSPNKTFSTRFYLAQNPDVSELEINPLVHYIRFGKKEGRETIGIPEIKSLSRLIKSDVQAHKELLDFQKVYEGIEPIPVTQVTDVVICVGKHPSNFKECLASIAEHTGLDHIHIHLVVHELDAEKLTQVPDLNYTVHTHSMENFNYSKANNIVLRSSKNDVVLLNDDTEVTKGWLEALRVASKGIALTGAHTGEYCSGNRDMWGEGGLLVTDNPINMFCAFIPLRLRDLIGTLDESFDYYGGEDVDYSIRARQAGVPLVISEAFVHHKDNQSFGHNKSMLIRESELLLIEKHGIGNPYSLETVFPLVSVIITTFNRPNLLKDAIESIQQSKYPNFEIIVIDDQSEPATLEILQALQEEYQNLTIVRPGIKMGPSRGKVLALNMAQGQFAYFTDDDDTVLANRISDPLDFLIQKPILDVVYCDYNVINNRGEIIPERSAQFDFEKFISREFVIGAGILFGRKDVFSSVPFDSTYDFAMDFDWVFRVVRQGYSIAHCPIRVMNYNRTGFTDQHLSGNQTSIRAHTRIVDRERLLQSLRRSKSA